ncbi:hypothetical protein BC835DRAFT_1309299 [Cytidiella melzeri]|nr:hypothetical protein BC835DRAFT_1309299 [Cytidiella melzeri]
MAHEDGSKAFAVVDVFDLAADRHPVWELPRLTRQFSEKRSLIVSCSERTDSGQTESHIEHRVLDEYIVNLHALHNAHLIHRVIPRVLTAPIPLFPTTEARRSCHNELATKLQAKQDLKDNRTRAATQKRRRVEEKVGSKRDAEFSTVDEGPEVQEEPRRVTLRLRCT